jgi:hypothetical protein
MRIPKSVVEELVKIGELPDEQFEEIVSALESIPLSMRHYRIFDTAALKISKDVQKHLDALFGLYVSRAAADVSISDYVTDIIENIKENPYATTADSVINTLNMRLARIFDIKTVNTVAKAHNVLLEHQYTFHRARILTDIRPVFGEKLKESPTAIIIHSLKLEYHQDGTHRAFFVALDSKDLESLIEVLQRAKAKAEILESSLASAELKQIEIG